MRVVIPISSPPFLKFFLWIRRLFTVEGRSLWLEYWLMIFSLKRIIYWASWNISSQFCLRLGFPLFKIEKVGWGDEGKKRSGDLCDRETMAIKIHACKITQFFFFIFQFHPKFVWHGHPSMLTGKKMLTGKNYIIIT